MFPLSVWSSPGTVCVDVHVIVTCRMPTPPLLPPCVFRLWRAGLTCRLSPVCVAYQLLRDCVTFRVLRAWVTTRTCVPLLGVGQPPTHDDSRGRERTYDRPDGTRDSLSGGDDSVTMSTHLAESIMKELVREAKASKRTWRFGRAAPAVGADDDDDAVTGQHNRLFGVGAGEDDVSFEAFALAALDERARRRAEDNDSVARTGSRRSSQSSRRRVRRSVRSELAEEAKAELEQRREQARIAAVSERNPVLARVFNALDVEQRGALDLEQLVLLLSEMCVPVDVAEVMNRAEVVADWHAMGRRKARRRAYREGREMRFLQVRHAKRVFRFERERKREREEGE